MTALTEIHSTVKEFYRRNYYEALALIVESIRDRFDRPGYRVYQCLENLLLKAGRLYRRISPCCVQLHT